MDLATIIGVLLGLSLMAWAVFSGGNLTAFVEPASLVIVVGGAASATLISFPFARLRALLAVTRKAFTQKVQSPEKLIRDLVGFAEIARRDGILSLESKTQEIDDPFVVRGIQMAVDGTDPDLIEQIMSAELENLVERHESGKSIYEALGRYAPAFGMIGTLIGLIIMLSNMDSPDQIGTGMAVALITTLYGVLLANLVFLPIADKLGRRSSEEVLLKSIIIRGVMSIQSGDNPRIVEQKLRTFLPPDQRAGETRADQAV